MMKIFNKIFVAISIAIALVACVNEPEIELNVDADTIQIGPDGGVRTVKVASSGKWVVTSSVPWISISPANGIGSTECQVRIDSALLASREAIIRVTEVAAAAGEQKRQDFKVVQEGYKYSLTLDNANVEIPSYEDLAKRSISVKVKANFNFDVQMPDGVEWLEKDNTKIEFDDRVARPREVTLKFTYDINFEEAPRDALIKFIPRKSDLVCERKDDLNITQRAADKIEIGVKGDSLALMAIARSLGMMTSWDPADRMRDWAGVTVWDTKDEKRGRVRSAEFGMFWTKEPIPFQVKYLTEIESIKFFGNANTFLLDNLDCGPHICELTQLKRLTIGAYGLTGLHEDFTKLKNLESLNLGSNNFQTIPEVITEENFPNLKSLELNTNRRYTITDLSNDTRKNIGGFIDEPSLPMRLLTWNNLDTLRLSMNYLQGTLPSDEQMREVVSGRWTDAELKDSIGVNFFDGRDIPKVLPTIKFFAINGNRFYGTLPDWILYHPHLDLWYPDLLVFPQEGKAKDGTMAMFTNAPTNLNYYYDIFVNKKYNPKNFTEE